MELYELLFDKNVMGSSGDIKHFFLSPIQEAWIKKELVEGRTVPLYVTTKNKEKYGDCEIGGIIAINKAI